MYFRTVSLKAMSCLHVNINKILQRTIAVHHVNHYLAKKKLLWLYDLANTSLIRHRTIYGNKRVNFKASCIHGSSWKYRSKRMKERGHANEGSVRAGVVNSCL